MEEDPDRIVWRGSTVKGTCTDIEKEFLRCTSVSDPCVFDHTQPPHQVPDSSTVRPQYILEKSLEHVKRCVDDAIRSR